VLFDDSGGIWRKRMIGIGEPMARIRMAFSTLGRGIGAKIGVAIFLLVCSAGAITAAEDPRVESARRAFSILDMDGDKKVTDVEFATRKIDAFSTPDRNEDNYLSEDEVRITPEQFKAVDRNGDGKVSGLEFINSDYGQFAPYDADKDGTVDLDELTRVLAGQ
jgi:Ca2+-binding EF-hand superfamily protein